MEGTLLVDFDNSLALDFSEINNRCTTVHLPHHRLILSCCEKKKRITKLCHTKGTQIIRVFEKRRVRYTHFGPRKFAMLVTACPEFGTCQSICREFSSTPQKCAQHVLRFPVFAIFFHPIG